MRSLANSCEVGTTSTSAPVVNPDGPINTTTPETTSILTARPSTPTGSAGGAGGAVSSTSSKAEGANVGYVGGGSSLWVILS